MRTLEHSSSCGPIFDASKQTIDETGSKSKAGCSSPDAVADDISVSFLNALLTEDPDRLAAACIPLLIDKSSSNKQEQQQQQQHDTKKVQQQQLSLLEQQWNKFHSSLVRQVNEENLKSTVGSSTEYNDNITTKSSSPSSSSSSSTTTENNPSKTTVAQYPYSETSNKQGYKEDTTTLDGGKTSKRIPKKKIMLPPLLEQSIQQVAQSGFLTTNELGRILLLSSRALYTSLGNDFCWICLCRSRVPGIAQSILPQIKTESDNICQPNDRVNNNRSNQNSNHDNAVKKKDAAWVFRQFTKSVAKQKLYHTNVDSANVSSEPTSVWPQLDPPTLSINDLQLFVQWHPSRNGDQCPTTMFLPQDALVTFLEQGHVTVPIQQLLARDDGLNDNNNNNNSNNSSNNDALTFDVDKLNEIVLSVHILRKDRWECCCLHKTDEYSWDGNASPPFGLIPTNNVNNNNNGNNNDIDNDDRFNVDPSTNGSPDDSSSSGNSQTTKVSLERGNLYLGPALPVLLQTSGTELESRLARGNCEAGGFELLLVAHAVRYKQTSSSSSSSSRTSLSSSSRTSTILTYNNNTATAAAATDVGTDNTTSSSSLSSSSSTTLTRMTRRASFSSSSSPTRTRTPSSSSQQCRRHHHSRNATTTSTVTNNNMKPPQQLQHNGTTTDKKNNDKKKVRRRRTWQVQNITFQFWANFNDQLCIYETSEQEQLHGVTMLHIWDQLMGWEDV